MLFPHQPGCPTCGCGCPVTLTVLARCNAAVLAAALIEILDGVGNVLFSCTGSSCVFTIDGLTAYQVRISKAGYHTKTYALAATGCVGTRSFTAGTWPTTYTLAIQANANAAGKTLGTCRVPGATITITGDATGSGTTDASGLLTLTLSTSAAALSQTITITTAVPAGRGMATPAPINRTFDPCASTSLTQAINIGPSSGHVNIVGSGLFASGYFLPDTLPYSDDIGACTAVYGAETTPDDSDTNCPSTTGGPWRGKYTYTSTKISTQIVCPPNSTRWVKNQTGTVTVRVSIGWTSPSGSCGDGTWTVHRLVVADCQGDCSFANPEGQLSPLTNTSGFVPARRRGCASPQSATTAIGPAFAFGVDFPGYTSAESFTQLCGDGITRSIPETAVHADITGTI